MKWKHRRGPTATPAVVTLNGLQATGVRGAEAGSNTSGGLPMMASYSNGSAADLELALQRTLAPPEHSARVAVSLWLGRDRRLSLAQPAISQVA